MHANVHFALGVIIASIANFFVPLHLIEYSLIVICSFGVDFDFLFSRFETKDKGNHRNFFTHTIYPGLIIFIAGIIVYSVFNYHIIWICGISYISHILFDCVDWGVRFFFTEKYYGLYILITQDEKNLNRNYGKLLRRLKEEDEFFFIKRYYQNNFIIFLDVALSLLGLGILFLFTPDYWFIYVGFFLLLEYHLKLKKKAEQS